ncbi:uncharacterized protein LOC129404421 [Sorex araneus]|uniref:uncharacterized protein LOC129404421 n=1 Tax=Sorex araneus TaxID=42254 RepID=UPI002433FC06|nr:uncharacterized protein LOC129404421 [Sorex araneus]
MSLNLDRTRTQDEDNLTSNDNRCKALKSQTQATFQQGPAAPDHAVSSGSFLALKRDSFSLPLPVPSTASPQDPVPIPLAQPRPPARRFLSTLTPVWGLVYGSLLGVSVSPVPVVTTFGPSAFHLLRGTFLRPLTSTILRVYTRSNFLGPDPPGPSGQLALPPSEPPVHSPDLCPLGGTHHSGPPPPMKFKVCPPKPPRSRGGIRCNTTLNQQHPGEEEIRRDQDRPTPLASGSAQSGDETSLTTVPGTNTNTTPSLSVPRYTAVRDLSREDLPEPQTRCNSCGPQMAPPVNRSHRGNRFLKFWRRIRRSRAPATRGQAPRARLLNRALRCCLPCMYGRMNP